MKITLEQADTISLFDNHGCQLGLGRVQNLFQTMANEHREAAVTATARREAEYAARDARNNCPG